MKTIFRVLSIIFAAGIISACAGVPQKADPAGRVPAMTPDYDGVTIPCNIAPLTFAYDEGGSRYVTVFSAGDDAVVVKGKDRAVPSAKEWKKLLGAGSRVSVETYMRKDGAWTRFEPFVIDVAGEIDQFLSYRLIPPNFENFEHLALIIRDLTSYDEREFYNNELLKEGSQVQCMNCHHFRNYGTDEMQIHVRQYLGGTMILRGDDIRKINMKNDSTISSGVYPAWNPVYDYIAYSTNFTYQEFHSHDRNLLEVIDDNSQLSSTILTATRCRSSMTILTLWNASLHGRLTAAGCISLRHTCPMKASRNRRRHTSTIITRTSDTTSAT